MDSFRKGLFNFEVLSVLIHYFMFHDAGQNQWPSSWRIATREAKLYVGNEGESWLISSLFNWPNWKLMLVSPLLPNDASLNKGHDCCSLCSGMANQEENLSLFPSFLLFKYIISWMNDTSTPSSKWYLACSLCLCWKFITSLELGTLLETRQNKPQFVVWLSLPWYVFLRCWYYVLCIGVCTLLRSLSTYSKQYRAS